MKRILILIILLSLTSGCLMGNTNYNHNIKISDNSSSIEINTVDVEKRNIIETFARDVDKKSFNSLITNISDKTLGFSMRLNNTESGCEYHYSVPNKIEAIDNKLIIYTEQRKELKKKYRNKISYSCAEYNRHIIVEHDIRIKGNNLDNVQEINIKREMGKDKNLKTSEVYDK